MYGWVINDSINFPGSFFLAERLPWAQPDLVANHVKARQSLIERVVATESGWARGKRSAICSSKLCEGFIIFEQCCPYAMDLTSDILLTTAVHALWEIRG